MNSLALDQLKSLTTDQCDQAQAQALALVPARIGSHPRRRLDQDVQP